jgi:4-amino-4-deoxy-L-arabinose transferase-like glycosyltransferase
MQTLHLLQDVIHKLEVGLGRRFVRYLVFALGVSALLIIYDYHCYRNMASPTAMDAAQLAHNIASGRGYTTQFIRPLSIYLVKQKNRNAADNDPARLNSGHPDLANPPVYPVVLAGLMKVLPFHYDTALKGAFWAQKSTFWSEPDPGAPGGRRGTRYQPDFLIALFNQFLFLVLLALVFFWARRLFDFAVARLSIVLLLGAEILWRFSVSGLSTMLLLVIFMALIWCLTLWESEVREPKRGPKSLMFLSLAVGVVAGVGGLTRYAFMAMIVPVALFLLVFGGPRRALYCIAAVVGFAAVVSPWLARNYAVSGRLFGTADYNMIEWFYPGFRLQRSLQPEVLHFSLAAYFRKLAVNFMPVLQEDLFKMAGGWISAFFLVGLMVGFRNAGLRRMRYFVVGCIVTLAITEALARTQLTNETPEINSENLLVLLAPITMVYGVGLFYVLLDQMKIPFYQLRYVATGVFIAVLLLPLLFDLTTASKGPVVFPPYRPDAIQSSAHYLKQDELMMSDVPWAVAWYGDRQCVWMTLNATASRDNPVEWQESFYAINDALKPIHALYLTPRSLDSHLQSQLLLGKQLSWGHFILDVLLEGQAPPAPFPLTKTPPRNLEYLRDQLLLCDSARWR